MAGVGKAIIFDPSPTGIGMPGPRQVARSEAPTQVLPTYWRLSGDRDPVTEPVPVTGTPGN